MSAIEFTANAGKTFSVQLYNATTGASIGSAITGITDGTTPTLYRASTGSAEGLAYVVATTTNLRVAGYTNLSNPAINGYSQLRDSIAEVESAVITVLPGRDRGLPQSNRGRIIIAESELITISRQVVDGNGSPLNLSGRTLQFVIQDARGIDIAVVANASIAVSGTNSDTYSFAIPSAASARVGNFTYALNDIGPTKAEIAKGDWIVESRPLADS